MFVRLFIIPFFFFCYLPQVVYSKPHSHSKEIRKFEESLNELAQRQDYPGLLSFFTESMKAHTSGKKSKDVHKARKELTAFWESLENPDLHHYFGLSSVSDFIKASWDIYPKYVKAIAALDQTHAITNSRFSSFGCFQGIFPEELTDALIQSLAHAKVIPIIEEDYNKQFHAFIGFHQFEGYFNSHHKFLMLEDDQMKALTPLLETLKNPVSDCIGTHWRVVNVRCWKTHPRELQHDQNGGWHRDGFPFSSWKLMIYPFGASFEKGTTEFVSQGNLQHVDGPKGTWFLFKNSEIDHRTIAPPLVHGAEDRLIIELTLVPSLDWSGEPFCAGLNASWPYSPWFNPVLQKRDPASKGVKCLNIGGGANFNSRGWLNLEGAESPTNPSPFYLNPNCRFPLNDESIDWIYTSHVLEHLNIPTVFRVLSESTRVLAKNGSFVIKIPDYDTALDCWRREDMSFFEERIWGFPIYTWKNRNLSDCLDYRAAMVFYSFASPEFGVLFSGKETDRAPGAYFGPPAVSVAFLRQLIEKNSPSQIVAELRKIVLANEKSPQICHQSAWSREELRELVELFDLEVVSFDQDFILQTCGHIPGIGTMKEHSMYCLIRKK